VARAGAGAPAICPRGQDLTTGLRGAALALPPHEQRQQQGAHGPARQHRRGADTKQPRCRLGPGRDMRATTSHRPGPASFVTRAGSPTAGLGVFTDGVFD